MPIQMSVCFVSQRATASSCHIADASLEHRLVANTARSAAWLPCARGETWQAMSAAPLPGRSASPPAVEAVKGPGLRHTHTQLPAESIGAPDGRPQAFALPMRLCLLWPWPHLSRCTCLAAKRSLLNHGLLAACPTSTKGRSLLSAWRAN